MSPEQSWTDAVLAALDERVRVVSVPNVHWTDGACVDLDAVSARTHELGAHLVIDGSQSIGAMPFDVAALRPDFVTTVGYKWLLGPIGVSYLYVAEQHREGVPIEQNWIARAGSEDFARLVDYRDEYQPGARRFDVGQRTEFELVPMAVAALEQLERVGRRAHRHRAGRRHRVGRRHRDVARTRRDAARAARSAHARRAPPRERAAPASCPRSRRPTATPPCAARCCGSRRTST